MTRLGPFAGLVVWAVCVAAVCVALTVSSGGCRSGQTERNIVTAAQYAAELTACVETAQTLAESRACRCRVNTAWQRACVDDIGGKP